MPLVALLRNRLLGLLLAGAFVQKVLEVHDIVTGVLRKWLSSGIALCSSEDLGTFLQDHGRGTLIRFYYQSITVAYRQPTHRNIVNRRCFVIVFSICRRLIIHPSNLRECTTHTTTIFGTIGAFGDELGTALYQRMVLCGVAADILSTIRPLALARSEMEASAHEIMSRA